MALPPRRVGHRRWHVVRARWTVAAAVVVAVPIAYAVGAYLAPPHGTGARGATVQSVDVGADPAGACMPGNLLEDSPHALYVGIHGGGVRAGLLVTVAVTGQGGTDTMTAHAPQADRSGCTVVRFGAGGGSATVWASDDYSIAVSLGSPPVPSGPVTAFSIAAGITDD
jgi:hypothetical protein